jgi:hypothetical protein
MAYEVFALENEEQIFFLSFRKEHLIATEGQEKYLLFISQIGSPLV